MPRPTQVHSNNANRWAAVIKPSLMKLMSIHRKLSMLLAVMLLVGVVVIIGVASLIPALRMEKKQILFEFGTANTWTLTTQGFFIDSEGNIYLYSNDSRDTEAFFRFFGEREVPYTSSKLLKYYGNSNQVVGKIDPSTLNEMINLVIPASIGPFSNDDPLTPSSCASKDAGIYSYRAYLYNSTQKTYEPVALYTMGDFRSVNLSQEGRILHKWLETLCIENDYFTSCNPSQYICRP